MTRSRSLRVLLAWSPAALYMLLIWWLSSQTLAISTAEFPFHDKGVHACEYAGLGVFLSHALSGTFGAWSRQRVWLIAVVLTVLFGWSDEIHQAFVPGRNSDIYDLVADSIGAVIGATARAFVPVRWGRFGRSEESRS